LKHRQKNLSQKQQENQKRTLRRVEMLHITELLRLKYNYEKAIAAGKNVAFMEDKLDKVNELIAKHEQKVAERQSRQAEKVKAVLAEVVVPEPVVATEPEVVEAVDAVEETGNKKKSGKKKD